MRFDLSKFRKISSNETHATLRHPDGHEIKIALKSLNPKLKQELTSLKMADGGYVASDPKKPEPVAAPLPVPGTPPNIDIDKAKKLKAGFLSNMYAHGGQVQHFVNGGIAKSEEKAAPPTTQQPTIVINTGTPQQPTGAPPVDPSMAPPPEPSMAQKVGHAYGDALRQGAIQGVSNVTAPIRAAYDYVGKPLLSGAGAVVQGLMGQDPNAQAAMAPPPEAPTAPQQQQPSAAAPTQAAPTDPFGYGALNEAYKQAQGSAGLGLEQEAAAQAKAGQAEAKAAHQAMAAQQATMNRFQATNDRLVQEREAVLKDYKDGHIDPEHYMKSMDSGKRLSTAFGLIIGGMGAGITHTENPAEKFLQAAIDRDVDAQKANLGKQQNLLNANLQQFGNLRDATNMTRLMQADILADKMSEAAANLKDPMAQARLLQAKANLIEKYAPLQQESAMRLSFLSNPQAAPEQKIRAVVPKDQQDNAYKELKEAQDTVAFKDNLLAAMQKINLLNTAGNRMMSPLQSTSQIDALWQPLEAALSKNTAGRFTEQDSEMLHRLKPALTDSPETVRVKIAQANKLASEKLHFPLLKTWGIDVNSLGRFNAAGGSRIPESAPVR